ncbi:MAG: RdgB/HAM1 family non-canonical purine NTP pyrophosphatase [Fidelibacterota bacterium]|nr:MAG: RdgB/HAM1 family non-canonical purine NTP pyrophosphatase [Candidatus Neomarinimicrobiota bacterium]
MKWVVATHNRDKLKEIQDIFADFGVQLVDLDAFPHIDPVEESGTSLRDNALLKARAVHAETGLPTVADDTGLEVDALDGAPGIYSARFAGTGASYRDNVEKLLASLQNVHRDRRTARFRTCAVYVDGAREAAAEGVIEGSITQDPRGENGFGYDPVFIVEGTEQTFGQMTAEQKKQISHRAKAFQALHHQLARSLSNNVIKETPA